MHDVGQGTRPAYDGSVRSQCLLLPLSQAARHIDDGVAGDGHANTLKLVQQISRQRSSARAKLPDL